MTWIELRDYIDRNIIPAELGHERVWVRGDPAIPEDAKMAPLVVTRMTVYGTPGPELYVKTPGA